ncbi:verrucotoxin subunit beta-like protein [Labeo rohita]|uniref:Verrucotoxin subunit beta-like protein n=1 Tax=Labeo rohita TaxID=84645 RepID=A0A498M0I1_LABRO|nr:verrucotoxin subunit beta-like protein [Labeo rohita]
MDSVGVNLIKTAALGRPFQLGMLYDCRKDKLIAGIRLWNIEQLEQNTCSRPQINTDFTVTASDSITDKSNLLNIEGRLNLSVLGGLIQVSGAAKYLKDTKTSFIQQRLTLHYHSTSEFKELTVNQLPSENIPDDGLDIATHIVTGILYGADACFVFDRQVSSDEDKRTVKGEVNLALEKLLGVISVDANADLNMNDNEKIAVKNFTCTFYGDFQLPSNPTTFEDAMKVFADLPKLLKENQKLAVPLRVWLYPLDKLHSRASKLHKDISMTLIHVLEDQNTVTLTDLCEETEYEIKFAAVGKLSYTTYSDNMHLRIIDKKLIMALDCVTDNLSFTESKCSELLQDPRTNTFSAFCKKIEAMKRFCKIYRQDFRDKSQSLIRSVQFCEEETCALTNLLQAHEESSLNTQDLKEWITRKEKELSTVNEFLQQLFDIGAEVNFTLDAVLSDIKMSKQQMKALCWCLYPEIASYAVSKSHDKTESESP